MPAMPDASLVSTKSFDDRVHCSSALCMQHFVISIEIVMNGMHMLYRSRHGRIMGSEWHTGPGYSPNLYGLHKEIEAMLQNHIVQ